jgi:hypothetical protein
MLERPAYGNGAAIKCLHQKKPAVRYRRCFWPELEKTLVERVLSKRLKGNKVSTTGILLKTRRLAEENKIENFKTYPSWAFRFMRRNNLCIPSTTSVGQKLPDDWEVEVEKFRLYIKENLCCVDPAHFGNMDEVPVSFDLLNLRSTKHDIIINVSGLHLKYPFFLSDVIETYVSFTHF